MGCAASALGRGVRGETGSRGDPWRCAGVRADPGKSFDFAWEGCIFRYLGYLKIILYMLYIVLSHICVAL